VFADHIAKLPDLIVLCVLAVGLNGKRPTRPCVEVNSMAAALTYQHKPQCAEQCLKIPEGDCSPALKNLIERFLTALHKARYYGHAASEHRRGVVQTYLFNLSSVIGVDTHFPLSTASFSRIVMRLSHASPAPGAP
jgi:hypothetical protein